MTDIFNLTVRTNKLDCIATYTLVLYLEEKLWG